MEGYYVPLPPGSMEGSRKFIVTHNYHPITIGTGLFIIDQKTQKVYEREATGTPGKLLGKFIRENGISKIVPLDYGKVPINYNRVSLKKPTDPKLYYEIGYQSMKTELDKQGHGFTLPSFDNFLSEFRPKRPEFVNSRGTIKSNKREMLMDIARPYYDKLVNDYNKFHTEEAERMTREKRTYQEASEREEAERIRKLYESIDPLVMEEITRRYNQIYQSLNDKQIIKNRGFPPFSVTASEYGELMHISPGSRDPTFIERFKVLSKPYKNKAMKRIENLQKGGKTKKHKSQKHKTYKVKHR